MKALKQVPLAVFGLALIVSVTTSAAPSNKARDVCVASPTGGGSFNTFVLRQVEPLITGGAVSLRGFFFVSSSQHVAAVSGSAVMASDGTIRIGLFVNSSAESTNDFTVSGVTDVNLAGIVSYDNDGDFKPNGTLSLGSVDCATVVIP